MEYNLISYLIYITLMGVVILHVGNVCYRQGLIWLDHLILENRELGKSINKLLLIGYYLVNLGYAIVLIYDWDKINSYREMIDSIAVYAGAILLLLGFLHVVNVFVLYRLFN